MKFKIENQKSGPSVNAGFTLVEIMIVVAVVGLLAAIALPSFAHARSTSQQDICINNLRQIDCAIQQWALENNAGSGTPVTWTDITPYVGRGTSGTLANVFCPADSSRGYASSYEISDTSSKPTCQIVSTSHLIN